MNPAYQIALNKAELSQLGTLIVILGQTEDIMVNTIAHLLKVDRPAANVIMGSTNVAQNVAVWSETIRNRTKDEDVIWLVELVNKEFKDLLGKRNDFIHAVFSDQSIFINGVFVQGGGFMMPGLGMVPRLPPIARRYKSSNKPHRSVSELPTLIDHMARLSCMVAHVGHVMAENSAESSTWLQRLAPSLPVRPGTAKERKAKARRDRQKSSRE